MSILISTTWRQVFHGVNKGKATTLLVKRLLLVSVTLPQRFHGKFQLFNKNSHLTIPDQFSKQSHVLNFANLMSSTKSIQTL